MAPTRKLLNACFETHPDNSELIQCLVCDRELGSVKWMDRRNNAAHLKSKRHNENLSFQEERNRKNAHSKQAQAREAAISYPLKEIGGHTHTVSDFNSLFVREDIDPITFHFGYTGTDDQFTTGFEVTQTEANFRQILDEAEQYGEWDVGEDFEKTSYDNTISNVMEQMMSMGVGEDEEPANEEEVQEYLNIKTDTSWYPWKNKSIFLLDMLDNLPRLRLSDSQLRTILWVMKQLGARDIPSLQTLRRVQEKMKNHTSIVTRQCKSARGNVFYANDIAAQIAEVDWANPLVRKWLRFYPEETRGPLKQTWQAEKWCKEMKFDQLSPMIKHAGQHFYVNELAKCSNKSYIIPLRWIYRNNQLCGDALLVHNIELLTKVKGELVVDRTQVHSIPITALKHALPRILEWRSNIKFQAKDRDLSALLPHYLRTKAKGRPVYTSYIALWGDDVSGNKSKQWNVHWNWYFVNVGCPKEMLAQEYFVKFASTSPYATTLEQAEELVNEVLRTHDEPIVTWDCETHEEVLIILGIHQLPADNPMQSTLASHIGLKGNCFCRRCKVGGTQEHKLSDVGYHALFEPGAPRSAADTLEEIKTQYTISISGESLKGHNGLESEKGLNLEEQQRSTGIKDSVAEVIFQHLITQKKKFEEEARSLKKNIEDIGVITDIDKRQFEWLQSQTAHLYNPFLKVPGLDPHCDTPTEPLHTVLLGVVKYIWEATCKEIADVNQLPMLETRLTCINTDGLGIPPLRASYLIQYRGGLIGRQFKSIMQTMIFTLHGLVSHDTITVWCSLGKIELESEIANLLDGMAIVDPTRIIQKPKLHILTHIVDDIRRYGPSVLFSTEIFECYNSVFRMCSVLSNHHAPSRDIALKFAEMGRFKHIVSGGFWRENEKWVQAGNNVRLFFQHNATLQALLRWVECTTVVPGSVKKQPAKKTTSIPWANTSAAQAIPITNSLQLEHHHSTYEPAIHVVSQAQEAVKCGQFAVYGDPKSESRYIGRILDIFRPLENRSQLSPLVVLERFYLGLQHHVLEMPTLHRDEQSMLHVVLAQDILFAINIQHDCERAGCTATGTVPEIQERQKTNRMRAVISHQDDQHYIVNLHGLRNAHLLRRVFQTSSQLIASKPVADDRYKLHSDIAQQLRKLNIVKKVAAQEKREATKRRKAAEEVARGGATGKRQRNS